VDISELALIFPSTVSFHLLVFPSFFSKAGAPSSLLSCLLLITLLWSLGELTTGAKGADPFCRQRFR